MTDTELTRLLDLACCAPTPATLSLCLAGVLSGLDAAGGELSEEYTQTLLDLPTGRFVSRLPGPELHALLGRTDLLVAMDLLIRLTDDPVALRAIALDAADHGQYEDVAAALLVNDVVRADPELLLLALAGTDTFSRTDPQTGKISKPRPAAPWLTGEPTLLAQISRETDALHVLLAGPAPLPLIELVTAARPASARHRRPDGSLPAWDITVLPAAAVLAVHPQLTAKAATALLVTAEQDRRTRSDRARVRGSVAQALCRRPDLATVLSRREDGRVRPDRLVKTLRTLARELNEGAGTLGAVACTLAEGPEPLAEDVQWALATVNGARLLLATDPATSPALLHALARDLHDGPLTDLAFTAQPPTADDPAGWCPLWQPPGWADHWRDAADDTLALALQANPSLPPAGRSLLPAAVCTTAVGQALALAGAPEEAWAMSVRCVPPNRVSVGAWVATLLATGAPSALSA